jgi:hypothetical protein
MKPEITLIYDADCPNAAEARAVLRRALERAGLDLEWVEHDRAAPGVPKALTRFGSPTILVNGIDVGGESGEAAAASCRIYADSCGLRGVPPLEAIVDAIMSARSTTTQGRTLLSKTTASGALGFALASVLGSLCCLPIATGAAGVALAALGVAANPLWPVFASASLILLAVTVVQTTRGGGTLGGGRCELGELPRKQWLFVSIIGFLTLLLLTLPLWSTEMAYRLTR